MKKSFQCLWLWFAAMHALSSCNFSAGTKTDLVSGLSSSWNGLDVKNIYFVDAEDQAITNNEVVWNTSCSFVFEGISNYTLKEGNAYPGMIMTVTDSNGEEVISFDDMLADYTEGISPSDASILRATLTIGSPMQIGETYTLTTRVFDKQNEEARIISKVTVTVVE